MEETRDDDSKEAEKWKLHDEYRKRAPFRTVPDMTENCVQTDKEDAAENPTPPRQRTAWSQTPDVKTPDTKEKNIKNTIQKNISSKTLGDSVGQEHKEELIANTTEHGKPTFEITLIGGRNRERREHLKDRSQIKLHKIEYGFSDRSCYWR